MDCGGSTTVPVARRTRLQVKRRSFPQESSRRIRSREAVKSRRPGPGKQLSGSGSSTSEEANSESETELECRPKNAVEDSEFVEFLLIDRDGANVRKFYLDRMTLKNHEIDSGSAASCKVCRHCVCKRRKNSPAVGSKQGNSSSVRTRDSSRDFDKKKRLRNKRKGITEGRTSVFPITISDDEQVDGEDVEPKDLPAKKHGDGDVSKSSQEWIPLKKRHKFEEQELPGVDMNSTLVDINLKSPLDMEGDKLFKEMNTSTPTETTEILAAIPLSTIKKEMM